MCACMCMFAFVCWYVVCVYVCGSVVCVCVFEVSELSLFFYSADMSSCTNHDHPSLGAGSSDDIGGVVHCMYLTIYNYG